MLWDLDLCDKRFKIKINKNYKSFTERPLKRYIHTSLAAERKSGEDSCVSVYLQGSIFPFLISLISFFSGHKFFRDEARHTPAECGCRPEVQHNRTLIQCSTVSLPELQEPSQCFPQLLQGS